MWSVDVQQQLNVVSGFWGLVLNLTLWSCSRQRGLNASLQLLHTSCSPHIFHSTQTKAATRTYSILPQTRSRRRTQRQHTAEQFQGSRNLCYLWDRWPLWSFLRPILTSFLTSASMKEGTTTSPLAYLGHTTKALTRIGTPWWACVGVCLEVLESEWQGQKTKPLLPACHLIWTHTAQVSAYPGPASCAKGRR